MKRVLTKQFGLIIIESLSSEYKKTGSSLHQELRNKTFVEPCLSLKFFEVNNKNELSQLFVNITNELRSLTFFPIIHIDAHGSIDGLTLASDELVYWDELFNMTREINVLMLNSLVLVLALCDGISIISRINPEKRAPFKVIIGCEKRIGENDLLKAFELFYDNFFFSFDSFESVDKMNSLWENKPIFHSLTSDYCFDYISDIERDSKHFERLINEKAIMEKSTNPQFSKIEFPKVKEYVKNKLIKMSDELKSKRDYFLINDLKNNS